MDKSKLGSRSTSAFLNTQRSFDWQKNPQVNASPVYLHGTLLKKEAQVPTSNGNWDSFMSRTGAEKRRGHFCAQRWKDYSEGFRTLNPNHDGHSDPKPQSVKIVRQDNRSPNMFESLNQAKSYEELGHVSKGVERDGKLMYGNGTTTNSPFYNENQKQTTYRQKPLYDESKMRNTSQGFFGDNRASKGYTTERSTIERLSQISTLPGPSRQETAQKGHGVKQIRRDYSSSIQTLPGQGPSASPRREKVEPIPPSNFHARNTLTSAQHENIVGPPEIKSGPKREMIPENSNYSAYKQQGEVVEFNAYASGKGRNVPAERRLLNGVKKEIPLIDTHKNRPATARDMFASSIRFL